jgi:hypothetical protein
LYFVTGTGTDLIGNPTTTWERFKLVINADEVIREYDSSGNVSSYFYDQNSYTQYVCLKECPAG